MTIFWATLNQTAFLLLFVIMGYILSYGKFVPANTHGILSKLENYIFIPALVLGTFINNFSIEKISTAGEVFLGSFLLEIIVIPISLLLVKIFSKDKYEQQIVLYGLCFANFAYMGNAVVSALFPEIFMEYLIFILPLWIFIYLWAVPTLLMGEDTEKQSLGKRMKSIVNPMFICMMIGMVIGLVQIPVPGFVASAITTAGNCMSPIAMLITGMTIAQSKVGDILKIKSVYISTFLRLLVFPLCFLAVLSIIPIPETLAICALCSLAMPLGLNTIIIPSAYGKDTSLAAGMALVSHVLSCLTIPVIFMLFEKII